MRLSIIITSLNLALPLIGVSQVKKSGTISQPKIINYKTQVLTPSPDASYNITGDPFKLKSGTMVTNKLRAAFTGPKTSLSAFNEGVQYQFKQGIFPTETGTNGFNINTHNSFIKGEGPGVTTIHFISKQTSGETGFSFSKEAGLTDRLIRGGGITNLTLRSNNNNIIDFGLQLDYNEYMLLENVNFENFFKSALMGCFWESNFENIVIRNSGAGQKMVDGVPDHGLLDFDSHSKLGNRDACNNSNFSKLTFSSCLGTHIRAVAAANTIVNINIFGLYDETYPHDAGDLDDFPIYYLRGVKNFNITGGFLTVNSTTVNRNSIGLRIASDLRNGMVNLTNFEFLQNHGTETFKENIYRRLKTFIYLERNQAISLTNVTINDASGSVGLGLPSKYLIDGEAGSVVYLNNVHFMVKKGVWGQDNIINPLIKKQGSITIIYYSNDGPTGEKEFIKY